MSRSLACLTLVTMFLAATAAAQQSDAAIAARCRAEVVELHQFLESWSNAELPDTEEAFARFAEVIAPSFLIVDPDGTTLDRQPIVDAIREAHGRWRNAPGRIRIDNFRLHQSSADWALATYEEWHELPGQTTGRLSSVLFGAKAGTPNELEWLHLHEVWLERDANGD